MKHKLKILALIVAMIGALILLNYLLTHNENQPNNYDKIPALSPLSTSEKNEKMIEAAQELEQAKKAGDEEGEHNAIQKFAKAIGGKTGAMLGMADSTVNKVHFYGRVIDQNGSGVADAKVDIDIGGGGDLAPGSGLRYFTTDTAGYFEVNGKGHGLSILDVKHPEISDLFTRSRGGVKTRGGPDLEATDQYGEKYNWSSYKDKSNPLEVSVWRVEKFEKVETKSGAYHVPANGEKILFDGKLKASCQRNAMKNNSDYGDWSIILSPVDGGIQETDELYLNSAPDTGYLPEVTVSSKQTDPTYVYRIYPAKHYYYYTNNGKFYGSLEMAFEPFAKLDKCILMTKMKFNPSGSKNLAMRSEH